MKEKIEVNLKLALAVTLLKRGLHSGCSEVEESQSQKKVITSRMTPKLVFDTCLIIRNHSRDNILIIFFECIGLQSLHDCHLAFYTCRILLLPNLIVHLVLSIGVNLFIFVNINL